MVACASSHASADLGGRYVRLGGGRDDGRIVGHLRQVRNFGAEREERHPGDAVLAAQLEHRLVGAFDHAVGVLHAGDPGRQRRRSCSTVTLLSPIAPILPSSRSADQFSQLAVEVDPLVARGDDARAARRARRRLTTSIRSTPRTASSPPPGPAAPRPLSGAEIAIGVPVGADLADQDQVVRIRGQRGADHLVARRKTARCRGG